MDGDCRIDSICLEGDVPPPQIPTAGLPYMTPYSPYTPLTRYPRTHSAPMRILRPEYQGAGHPSANRMCHYCSTTGNTIAEQVNLMVDLCCLLI